MAFALSQSLNLETADKASSTRDAVPRARVGNQRVRECGASYVTEARVPMAGFWERGAGPQKKGQAKRMEAWREGKVGGRIVKYLPLVIQERNSQKYQKLYITQ